LLSLAALVAALVLGVPLFMYAVQERLIFFPQPLPEARRAALAQHPGVEELSLEGADGKRLQAWHVKAQPGAPLVLYFGGNAEEVSWMVEEALGRAPGVAWLLTNYRGYGGSEGAPSQKALVADALAWYEHAAKRLGAKEIFVFGRSLGSGVAVAGLF
jgi:uncharacterized protein